jgi:hypothetical protein
MSEQEKPKSFMQELDQWIEAKVVDPLRYGDAPDDPDARSVDDIVDEVHLAIRAKVLESYKNGIRAGSRPLPDGARKEQRYAQAKTR